MSRTSTRRTSSACIEDADVVLDGTDNFSTRYLLNDVCVKLGKPWVYCGVLASYGMTHTIQPGLTPCLRCIMGELPAPGTVATCDTAGIIGPIVALMGSIVAAEAIKLLVGKGEVNAGMVHVDLWDVSFDKFELGPPRPDCPACGTHQYEFLNAEAGTRDHVAVRSGRGAGVCTGSRGEAACRWRSGGAAALGGASAVHQSVPAPRDTSTTTSSRYFRTVARSSKAPQDEAEAATLYARYVGM